jgi:hypothetical protein
MRAKFCSESLKGRDQLSDLSVDANLIQVTFEK